MKTTRSVPSHNLAPCRRLLDGGEDSLRRSYGDSEAVLDQRCLGKQVLAVVGSQELRLGVDRPSHDRRVLEHDVHGDLSHQRRRGSTTWTSSSARNVSKNGRARGAFAARLRRVSSITKALRTRVCSPRAPARIRLRTKPESERAAANKTLVSMKTLLGLRGGFDAIPLAHELIAAIPPRLDQLL